MTKGWTAFIWRRRKKKKKIGVLIRNRLRSKLQISDIKIKQVQKINYLEIRPVSFFYERVIQVHATINRQKTSFIAIREKKAFHLIY